MLKAKLVSDRNGNDLFVPETYPSYENYDGDEFYIFDEKELEPHNAAYLNALRIIKDRALQQIDKSKYDVNGYRLLRATRSEYSRGDRTTRAWLIKKETSYSTHIDLKVVTNLIERDLYDNYNFVQLQRDADRKKMLYWHNSHTDDVEEYPQSEFVKSGLAAHLQDRGILGEALIVELQEITANYGTGHYEIAYWATEPI